jgi:uncharacterized protein (TIGR02996 family)
MAPILDRGARHAASSLRALAALGPDPRIARSIAAWLEKPPIHGSGRSRFYPAAFEVLAAQGDATVLAAIDAVLDPAVRERSMIRYGKQGLSALGLARTILAQREVPTLAGDARAIVERIRAKLDGLEREPSRAKKLARDLLEAVYASPDDDEPRLVYADALTEEGDVRGELIALQCARAKDGGAPSKRERALLKVHERAWLGSIEPAILKSGVVYERGFVASARYQLAKSGLADPFDRPEWSTLVELDVTPQAGYVGGARALLLRPHLRALRRVIGAQREDLVAIADHPTPLRWDTLSTKHWESARNEMAAILRRGLPTLPNLKAFGFVNETVDRSVIAALAEGPLGRTLERVFLAAITGEVAPLIEAARASAIARFEIHVLTRGLTLFLEDAGGARLAHVRVQCNRSVDAAETVMVLRPIGGLRSIAVVALGGAPAEGVVAAARALADERGAAFSA